MSNPHDLALERLAVYLEDLAARVRKAKTIQEVYDMGEKVIAIGLVLKHERAKWHQRLIGYMATWGD